MRNWFAYHRSLERVVLVVGVDEMSAEVDCRWQSLDGKVSGWSPRSVLGARDELEGRLRYLVFGIEEVQKALKALSMVGGQMNPAAAEHSAVERLAVLAGLFDTRPLNPQQVEIAEHYGQRLDEIAAELEAIYSGILSAQIVGTTSDLKCLFTNARLARAAVVGGMAGYLAARLELTHAAR